MFIALGIDIVLTLTFLFLRVKFQLTNLEGFFKILIFAIALVIVSTLGFRVAKILCREQNLCLLPQVHLDKEFLIKN